MRRFREPPLAVLYDRLTRASERRSGIRLTPAEVDWFIVSGAYFQIVKAAAGIAFDEAVARIEERGDTIPQALLECRGEPHPNERKTMLESQK